MAKTYTIIPSSINPGRRDSISDYWTNMMQGDNGGLVVGYTKYGYTSNQYRAVNFMFSASDFAQFSGKTITSIVLRIKVSSGTIGSTNYPYRVRYKYNNVATTTSSSDAWASGDATGSAYSDTDLAVWSNGQSSGTTTITANSTHDFDLGTTLPANGYVLAGTRSMAAYMILSEATLIVTTNETQKTLVYNANGGTGAPATQTGYSNPNTSYTFTVSNTIPTRTGYEFVKWNTAADGSGTSKTGGQTIAVSSSTTLYAQWNALKSTLNTIPTSTIGSSVTVSWTAKGSFQHKLKFSLGSATTSEVTIAAGTNSYSFSIPSAWLNQLPTTTSGTATATLTTLVSGSSIGTDSKTFTVQVASSVKPSIGTVTATKVNTNPTVESWNIFLQSYSQVQITANSLTAGTGANLASIRFTGQNMDTTLSVSGTSANATSNTITASGSQTYTVTLTDSRGRTASKTVSISVTAYQPPTVTSFTGYRCDADGTLNPTTGESLKAIASFAYTAVGTNTYTNSLQYKKTTASAWSTAGSNISSGATTIFAADTADPASTYDVKFTITDSLLNTTTMQITISSVVGIAFGLKNDRARFGGVTRQAGLEVDWDTQFNGDATIFGHKMSRGLLYRGIASDVSTDFDNIKTSGIYSTNGTTMTNAPDDYKWRFLIVMTNEADNLCGQILFSLRSSAPNYIFSRIYSGSPQTWKPWLSQFQTTQGDLSYTGDYVESNPSNINVANSTWTTVASITLTDGKWMVWYTARFNDGSNNVGRRMSIITTSDTSTTSLAVMLEDTRMTTTDQSTFCKANDVLVKQTQSTYYLRVWQNSGSTISTTARLHAIRIC